MTSDDHGLAPPRNHLQIPPAIREGKDAQLHLVVQHPLANAAGVQEFQFHAHLRPQFVEPVHAAADFPQVNRINSGDAHHGIGGNLLAAHFALQVEVAFEDFPAAFVEVLALTSRLPGPAASVDQSDPQMLFQPLNGQAGGRLQHVVGFRAAREAVEAHDITINLKRVNLHCYDE